MCRSSGLLQPQARKGSRGLRLSAAEPKFNRPMIAPHVTMTPQNYAITEPRRDFRTRGEGYNPGGEPTFEPAKDILQGADIPSRGLIKEIEAHTGGNIVMLLKGALRDQEAFIQSARALRWAPSSSSHGTIGWGETERIVQERLRVLVNQ